MKKALRCLFHSNHSVLLLDLGKYFFFYNLLLFNDERDLLWGGGLVPCGDIPQKTVEVTIVDATILVGLPHESFKRQFATLYKTNSEYSGSIVIVQKIKIEIFTNLDVLHLLSRKTQFCNFVCVCVSVCKHDIGYI